MLGVRVAPVNLVGMKRLLTSLALVATLSTACHTPTADYGRALPEGAPALLPLDSGDRIPDFATAWEERDNLRLAVDASIAWLRRPIAADRYPMAGIDHTRALTSLVRFRELLDESPGGAEFAASVQREFQVYKSAGWDGRGGGVLFTAYCTPLLRGSLEPTVRYRWPLYGLPSDLVKGPGGETLGMQLPHGLMPYPSRRAIEIGQLLENRGLELIWLADPLDAYIAHVNGSAFVTLPDGELRRFGYAGKNGRGYISLGGELIDAGLLSAEGMSLGAIREWAEDTDEEVLLEYLRRNQSFVFFQPIAGNPHGSLDFPVTKESSLATDKTLFPPGALVFVEADVPDAYGNPRPFQKFLLDQDTGGAIRTAGRADIYLGIGDAAEERAGASRSEGQLYYLFLLPEYEIGIDAGPARG